MPDDNTSAFLRLFIAIAIPPDVRKEIGRAQGRLRRHSPPSAIRWTRPDQFHVTLKYVGDVPLPQVAALEKSVSAACASCPVLQMKAHGVGFFPSAQRPRVLWAGAGDDSGQLAELHRQIDAAVRPFAPAEKPERFTGHITLGRFKPGRHGSVEKLLERATVLRDRHFGGWLAGAVEIVRSELTSTGAMHTPLASCPLAMALPRLADK
ncbi:MAG: RNA 2',3'-cyclic phosphodiesterase [Verrucomicrobiales bacterium]|nr:RNA 2',3'-cyclic phosphodiesterase [Verrucomicrobiales bacterium]